MPEEEFSVIPLEGTFNPKPYSEDGTATYQAPEPEPAAAVESVHAEPEPAAEPIAAEPLVPEPVAPEPPAQPDFDDIFRERLGMTITEAQAIFDEANALRQRHFVEDPDLVPKDDFAKEFLLTHNRGGDVHQYLAAKLTDFSKMTAEDIVKYDIASNLENKGAPKPELDYQYEAFMRSLGKSEEMEPDQERVFLERLAWKADRLKEKHSTELKKFQIPERQAPVEAQQVDVAAQVAANRKELLLEPSVREFVQSKKVKFGYTEYAVDPEKAIEIAADFSQSLKYLQNPDKSFNYPKYMKWLSYLPDMDAIDSTRDTTVAAKQKLAIVKELKNPSDPAAPPPVPNGRRVVEWGV